jgi:fucose permease
MILAGFINTIILDPKTKMKGNASQWIGTTHTKLISSFKIMIIIGLFIMTPIFEYIVDEDTALAIRFYLCGLWIVVSPFLRFYRELWTEHHRLKPQSL